MMEVGWAHMGGCTYQGIGFGKIRGTALQKESRVRRTSLVLNHHPHHHNRQTLETAQHVERLRTSVFFIAHIATFPLTSVLFFVPAIVDARHRLSLTSQ